MMIDEWNDLLHRFEEGEATAQDVEQAALTTLDIYFNRYPERILVNDCDESGLRVGTAAEIEIAIVRWEIGKDKFIATVTFRYPSTGPKVSEAATRRVEMNRENGDVLVIRPSV